MIPNILCKVGQNWYQFILLSALNFSLNCLQKSPNFCESIGQSEVKVNQIVPRSLIRNSGTPRIFDTDSYFSKKSLAVLPKMDGILKPIFKSRPYFPIYVLLYYTNFFSYSILMRKVT